MSWKIGCSSFTKQQGDSFCRANGMRSLSIDSDAKETEFKRLVVREGQVSTSCYCKSSNCDLSNLYFRDSSGQEAM